METATLRKGKIFGPASFYKKALLIALPVMLQMLIQNMVSLIDNFMVSGLGDVKMSGVNISGQILFVFMVLLNTICTAGGIFMSQYYGAGDKRGMRQALSFKAVLAAVAIVLYLLVCMVFPRQVLSLMVVGNSQADAILDEAVKYMFLMGFNGIPMAISTICSSSLREIGRVRTPLFISVIATLVNTFFNWVLIYGNLGAPRLEVQGAAIATITLFYAVGYWNDYFSSIIYIRNNRLWPMQTVLRQVLQTAQMNNMMYDDAKKGVAPETLKDAMIVVTMIPILCVYPFVQKHFVKGVMIGSIKG